MDSFIYLSDPSFSFLDIPFKPFTPLCHSRSHRRSLDCSDVWHGRHYVSMCMKLCALERVRTRQWCGSHSTKLSTQA